MRLIALFLMLFSTAVLGQISPYNGVAPSKSNLQAFVNATLLLAPGKTLQNASLLIENGRVKDYGFMIPIPQEAIIYNCEDQVIVPAFIESYSNLGIKIPESNPNTSSNPQLERLQKGPYYWNESIHPEYNAAQNLTVENLAIDEFLKMGFGLVLSHHTDGIARGTGVLHSIVSTNKESKMISSEAAQFFSLEKGSSKQTYPSSQMGSIALLRQAFYDWQWYVQAPSKELNLSLAAFEKNKNLPYIFHTEDKWELQRAAAIASEFDLSCSFVGSGYEYLYLENLKKINRRLIIPINFPHAYDVRDPYLAKEIPFSELKHWEMAPSNLYLLNQNKIAFCISSIGISNSDEFWKNIHKAIERGLTQDQALAALTIEPAKMINIATDFGTLEKGKVAAFSIYSSNPFNTKGKLLSSWYKGEEKFFETVSKHDVCGKYNIQLEQQQYPLTIQEENGSLKASIEVVQLKNQNGLMVKDTLRPQTYIQLKGDDIVLQFDLQQSNYKGLVALHGKVNSKFGVFEGDALMPDGKWTSWSAVKNTKGEKKKDQEVVAIDSAYAQHIWFPNTAFGFKKLPEKETIAFRNANVWTNEDAGIIKDATLIVQNGKISFVGTGNFTIPAGAKIIDAKGMHLTSGIIDEHSHIAVSKGVNESGQSITAEVRMSDVINPEDINIYRQLAGGVTAAQILHGSANAIGGQSALIKLKWGFSPQEMLIPNAPKFIKFALGENVKQANWGDNNAVRFPQTRMGVEQVFYDGFLRAKKYQQDWDAFSNNKKENLLKPRKDLELEALGEILRSERFISCHSYIQSEVNMLMHLCDSLGFRVNTFTHILEGYKVADKMREHGVAASTFSDWWAYKYEVNDAIPYNASLLNEQGVLVGINSDDAEMGRRLNQEAAKVVKYGGMSEVEAWKLVTLNPAKMLHLDQTMGSIKVGKDADLVLWSTNPLSIEAKVVYTLIDGMIMFDANQNVALEDKNKVERLRILSKMLISNQKGEVTKPFFKKKRRHFHCDTIGLEGTEGENSH